jgi:hypothetical protein
MMPDRKPEAAAFGSPGRTATVMRRATRPSTKPRRVYSAINCSQTRFCIP